METYPERIAPCGLYCGVCRMYQATQENDLALLERLARISMRRLTLGASVSAEELQCDGCRSVRRSLFCRECAIRTCTQQQSFQGCEECSDFPCDLIDRFPVPVGKKVILRSIPYRRAYGTEEWILAEERRYRCPVCGKGLFRGARQCPGCQSAVDLD